MAAPTVVGAASAGPAVPAVFGQDFLPAEVKRAFRIKVYALAATKAWVVFLITVSADWVLNDRDDSLLAVALVLMLVSFCVSAAALCVAWCVRRTYPWNFVGLAVTALFAGLFWAMADAYFFKDALNMPAQMVGMMGISYLVQIVGFRLVDNSAKMWTFYLTWIGWLVALVLDFAVIWGMQRPLISAAISGFMVFVSNWVILLSCGEALERCNTDDYMRVALTTTANLFVIVSTPVVFILFAIGGGAVDASVTGSSQEGQQQQQQRHEEGSIPIAVADIRQPQTQADQGAFFGGTPAADVQRV